MSEFLPNYFEYHTPNRRSIGDVALCGAQSGVQAAARTIEAAALACIGVEQLPPADMQPGAPTSRTAAQYQPVDMSRFYGRNSDYELAA